MDTMPYRTDHFRFDLQRLFQSVSLIKKCAVDLWPLLQTGSDITNSKGWKPENRPVTARFEKRIDQQYGYYGSFSISQLIAEALDGWTKGITKTSPGEPGADQLPALGKSRGLFTWQTREGNPRAVLSNQASWCVHFVPDQFHAPEEEARNSW